MGCCCYRKGTNFQANHNGHPPHLAERLLLLLPQRYKFSSKSQPILPNAVAPMVVVATAKVQIFKQITTCIVYRFYAKRCCCYRKGTNFQANHNNHANWNYLRKVVVATAKVQIFKQITTMPPPFRFAMLLLLLPQRYKFSSKSQLYGVIAPENAVVVATAKVQIFKQITTVRNGVAALVGCCCYRKGTNFQANHNYTVLSLPKVLVVVATAKVQIFKQITTV